MGLSCRSLLVSLLGCCRERRGVVGGWPDFSIRAGLGFGSNGKNHSSIFRCNLKLKETK